MELYLRWDRIMCNSYSSEIYTAAESPWQENRVAE